MATSKDEIPSAIPKLLYVYWKILGLCPFSLVDNEVISNPRSGLLYATILAMLYMISYGRMIGPRFGAMRTYESPMTITADFLGLSTEFLMMISYWLYSALRQNEFIKIINMFKRISASSKLIGIEQNYRKILRTLIFYVCFFNLLSITITVYDHLIIYETKNYKYDVWIPVNIPRTINRNVAVIFIIALWIIANIFHLLNEKISNLPADDAILTLKLPRSLPKPLEHGSLVTYAKPNLLESCGQIHADLVKLTKMIVNFFALPIILAIFSHMCLLASDIYILCRMFNDKKFSSGRDQAAFALMCAWIFFHAYETVIVVAISDATADEANRSGRVLHTMLAAGNSKNYVGTVTYAFLAHGQILSLGFLHRHLTISLWGLLRLRLSIIHTVFGTVGTYITVMVQLDIQNLQDKILNNVINQSTNTSELNESQG